MNAPLRDGTSLGIIGQGSFGAFAADKMSPYFNVYTYARRYNTDEDFARVAACDFVVLCVPLSGYEEVLARLQDLLPKTSILIDVCSVKEKPIELIKEYLPDHTVLASHPLFGPESAAKSLAGHNMVLCPTSQTPDDVIDQAKIFCEKLELKVSVMSAAEHDKLVADLQGLTFFIAQALVDYGVHGYDIITPSFKKLLDLADLEKHHSADLLATIEKGNKFVPASRQRFIDSITELDAKLKNGSAKIKKEQ